MRYSRRSFLSTAFMLPAAAALFRQKRLGSFSFPDDLSIKRFPKPEIIRYDSNCFTIHDVDTFLFSLEVPYPRIPRELWGDRFLKIRKAGFNTICSCVFWNYHERKEGEFDFSELEEFLKLAKENGFWVIARPGPYVDAEFERGGFPYWIIARRFPVRSMHPESLRSSKHWYDNVLPVIRRHQITQGGPIILMQIENELDFTNFKETEQREYIRFLARLSWDAGIEVPLITNETSVVRDRSDKDMVRIMDTCDFYPRWSFLVDRELQNLGPGATLEEKVAQSDRAVLASIRKQRKEQPDCLLGIAEVGTGYYSKFGGKLSQDEEGVEPAQTNAFTKTIIEQGATYFNYYLGCGGTNFDWAAKGVTTTYDFAAPIRECGGLWDKYYEIRGIGAFLGSFRKLLTRSEIVKNACQCSNPDITVSERVSGQSGFVFVRANTESEHHFKLTFRDPAGTGSFTVPREGELTLGPRAMKILPVQVPIAGGHLRYSTAEVLAHGNSYDRNFLVIYDEPGSVVEVALAADQEPQVIGDILYQSWDRDNRSVVFGFRVGEKEKFLLIDNRLQLVILPRHVALHTFIEEFPSSIAPGANRSESVAVPFITDAYLLTTTGSTGRSVWAELDFLPGDHTLIVLLPVQPEKCRIDGDGKQFQYDPQQHTANLSISTPQAPSKPLQIQQLQFSAEPFDTNLGNWIESPARVLEDIGPIPYGYVKYRTHITLNNEPQMYISAFSDDGKKVFLNGKLVPEASKPQKFVEFSPGSYAKVGPNSLEISYELFGSTEFGDEVQMAELKGINSVYLSGDPTASNRIQSWDLQVLPAAMRGRAVDPNFSFGGWKTASFENGGVEQELVPAFCWCRAEFSMDKADARWSIPWRLVFEANRDALIYLNGKFVGRYVTVGPQTEFYLPENCVNRTGQANVLTLLLAYTETPNVIKTLRVEPYPDACVRRTRVEFQW